MYYFKDHINLTNNLQDNLYILRQRQHLAENTPPAAIFSGTGQGQQTFQDSQLEDQMKRHKRTGWFNSEIEDDKQNQEYKDAKAELERRKGPRVDLDPSIKQSSDVKTDKVAGDWVERYAQKFDMDPRKLEAIRRGVIDMDTSGKGEDPISQTQDQVAQRGVEAYDRAKQFVVDMQKRDADKKAKTDTGSSASSPTTPSSRPYSDRGEGLAKPEATTSVTPEDAQSARTYAINHMTGEGQAQQIMRAFQNTDNPVEYSTKPSWATPPVSPPSSSYNPGYGRQDIGHAARSRLPHEQSTQEDAIRIGELMKFNVPGGVTIPAKPSSTPVKRTPGGTMVSDAQRAVTDKAAGALQDIIRGGSDWMKKQSMNSPGAGATEPQSFGTSSDDMSPGKPYVVPGSQDWNNMSHDEQNAMVTRAMKNNEAHKFTGGRFTRDQRERQDDPNIDRSRFSTDNAGDPFAADENQKSKLANDVIDRQKQNVIRSMMDAWNSDLDDESSGRPWFWPKASKTSETPKPAEDTRPTSGRQTLYPGSNSTSQEPSLQDTLNTMIDRMKNNSNLPRPTFRPRVSRRPRSR